MSTDQIQVGTETKPQGSLAIFIGGQPYSLIVLPPQRSQECLIQFRLTKVGGQSYTVTVDLDGIAHCDCADAIFRRHQIDRRGCKHSRACRNAGLLNLTWRENDHHKN